MRRAVVIGLVIAAGVTPAAAEAARGPVVRQLVVLPTGRAYADTVRAADTTVRVGRRRCAVAAATPLAALVRGDLPRLRILDFGACSRRARDAAGLYVKAIGRHGGFRDSGWVYKVGNRLATAGAADPTGPFGRGRLRTRARVLWLFCESAADGCQRTLALRVRPESGGVAVRVVAYDEEGRGVPAAGATVRSGDVSATTDASGFARLAMPSGRHRVRAEQDGLVRSFDEAVTVP